MASTKYPLETIDVPPWLPHEELARFPKKVFPNWRPGQRKPTTPREQDWDEFARIGVPLNGFIDYKLHGFLRSLGKSMTQMVIVTQGYSGGPVTTKVARVTVYWSCGVGQLPRLDMVGQGSDYVWGPLLLCVAPLNGAAPIQQVEEQEARINDPEFLRIVHQFGIAK